MAGQHRDRHLADASDEVGDRIDPIWGDIAHSARRLCSLVASGAGGVLAVVADRGVWARR